MSFLQVGGRFQLGQKLGEGAFGQIYMAVDELGNKRAVKLEPTNAEYPQLAYEARVYERMEGKRGVPRVYYFGQEGDFHVLVMDLLGPSLEDRFNRCNRMFNLSTVALLAVNTLRILEDFHDEGFIHRDLKPDNFLTSKRRSSTNVFLVDFGLSKCFWNPESNEHIPYRTGKNLTGTPRYASIRNHRGCEQSRRDDLETLGYILVYFLQGSLPWQNVTEKNRKARYRKIMEMKRSQVESGALCRHIPNAFQDYFIHVTQLKFTERPNYSYLRSLFKPLVEHHTYQWS
ncbi:MAG: casein kinase 1 family protein [Gammaproteobacteria bacterium]|nr:casein kinase 1 family protein [Gammaproteobacteria bacterium]